MCRYKLVPKTAFKFLTLTLDSRTKNGDKPFVKINIVLSAIIQYINNI